MKKYWFPIMMAATMLVISTAWSHGAQGYTKPADGILVKAEYDDQEPMSYAAVEVTAPDSDVAFQTGRTDRNGRFMFIPDQSGKWRVAISDGMGHRLVLGRLIDGNASGADKKAASQDPITVSFFRREGIVAGLSIIFGLCGILYGLKARRQTSRPLDA